MRRPISTAVVDQILGTNFHSFVIAGFHELNRGRQFKDNWSIRANTKAISDRVRWEFGRLTISLPPRMLKSHIASIALPAFLLGQNPAAEVIVTSYSEKLSAEFSDATRQLMMSAMYRRVFPAARLATKSQHLLTTTKGGNRRATSVEAATTGFGADVIIVDDPLNAQDALNAGARAKANDYLDKVLMTRLNEPGGGIVLIVAQRLHEDDMIGHVQAHGGWDHVSLPAIAAEDIHISSDVGGPYDFRKGQLLHPGRMGQSYLDGMRRTMGLAAYSAQFLQAPVPADGTMIFRDWLVYHDSPPIRDGGIITMSLDTATKTDPSNDYSVCTVWLEKEQTGKDPMHYLLDRWRDKVTYPDLKQKVQALWAAHRPHHLVIEDQGSGTVLIQELRRLGIPAVPFRSRDSKATRLSTVSDYFRSGLISLPRHAGWLAEYEAELLGFPGATHDDQVDSTTQYLGSVRCRPQGTFEYDMGESELEFSHEGLAQSLLAARWG